MSVSWEHAYGACGPAATEVLRAVATLNLPVVSSPAVGAAAGLHPAETAASLADLARDGWAVPGSALTMVEPARNWLATNSDSLVEPSQAVSIVRRFTEFHLAAVDRERHDAAEVGAWLEQHRAEILAAVQACDRDPLRSVGTRLAYAVWRSAALVRDPRWWQELASAGEALAIADRDPAMLADLLHHSAATFAEHGDRPRAEEQWVRALAIIRRSPSDPSDHRGVAVLTGLSALYKQWGRLSKALDLNLDLVDLRREAGDAVGAAEALDAVAVTMHAAGRLSSAIDYFAQADEAMSANEAADVPAVHARILVRWGRALWEQGHHGAAKRPWSRALAMLVDVDEAAADRVRALLATAPNDQLPSYCDEPGVSNTSSS